MREADFYCLPFVSNFSSQSTATIGALIGGGMFMAPCKTTKSMGKAESEWLKARSGFLLTTDHAQLEFTWQFDGTN
jgi:hypothetical protein